MGRTESDEIDSLVEEELSRNESEQASQRALDDLEVKSNNKPTVNTNVGSSASSQGTTPVSQGSMMRVQISTKSITAENAAGSRGSVGSANGTSKPKHADNDSVGGSSTGSGAESSSQMFKDLFSTSAHAKTKGIAGAFEAGGMPDRGDSRGDSRRKHKEIMSTEKTTTQLEEDLLIDPLLAAVDGKESNN
jgi:hypothetical protein